MSKKLTKEEFIRRAVEVHGNKYDYSKVNYVGLKTKVTIICPVHGEFEQSPNEHFNGHGCPKCSHNQPMTTDRFIKEAREVHGNKYDYSETKYINAKTKVVIKCPVHGKFTQLPYAHLKGHGCAKCTGRGQNSNDVISKIKETLGEKYDYRKSKYVNSNTKICVTCPEHGDFYALPYSLLHGHGCPKCSKTIVYTTEEWVALAKEKWGDRFDYSKVVYKNSHTKVCIICPEHGEFWQMPVAHLKGNGGCKLCSKKHQHTTEEWVSKAKEIHGDKYDYSKSVYVNANTKITVGCPIHGDFLTIPYSHIHGVGCPKCAKEVFDTQSFIEKARKVHGDKYDYSETKYVDAKTKVVIKCPEHGRFTQAPFSHLQGHGCPICCNDGTTVGKEYRNAYKLSQLTENDIQKNPADNRFFCLKGIDIVFLIRAGVLSKDFLPIARTISGTRTRLNTVLATIQNLQTRMENGEDTNEEIEDNTVENDVVDEINRLQELEADESDMVMDDNTGLPLLERQNILRNGDVPGLDRIEPTSENGRAIVENTLQTWFQTISNNPEFVEEIRNYHGSKFYDYIKELFFEKYNAITTMVNPEGYRLPYELHPYQKLLAYELEKRDSYSMWLDMGGGKTNCALYASRHNELHNTVVIAPKSVLHESWISQIYEAFPDSKVIAVFGTSVDEFKSKTDTLESKKYNKWLDTHLTVVRNIKEFKGFGVGYTYLLINYDKFSQDYAKKLGDTIACNHIDYVVLDEVQNVKVRSRKTTSERHVQVGYLMSQIRKCNPNLKASALTGTPVLNDIMEAKSIVEITTGEEVSGVKSNRVTLPNVVEANKALVLNGFRYCPSIPINHTTRKIEIECSPETERKIRLLGYMGRKSYYSELESILTIAKINSPEVINELKPGTIVYLLFPYKNNTANEVVSKIESLGFKVGTYFGCTVDKHQAYTDFVEGRTDILVASSPVCEGVNGLQNRCDNMIILSLPQTYGKYDQLIKRIVRRRKEDSELKDKEVTIIIPQMYIELNENDESDDDEWCWDESRWIAIRYKKSLADAVVDGELQKVFTIDWNKLYRNAMKVFQKGVKDEEAVVKPKIVVEVPEKERKARERATCVVTETHRLANSSNHHTTHQRFVDNPQEFDNYHDNRELSKADWVEDPVERIAAYINKRFKNKKIADLGCGTNKLSTLMKNGNTVTGFDHQQYKGNKDVVVADIGNLKGIVNDHEYDVAVFCLSLWGKDYEDYFDEAHRILKDYRKMLIVEPVSNFGDGKRYGSFTEFVQTVEKHGFARLGGVEERNNFAYFRFEKE